MTTAIDAGFVPAPAPRGSNDRQGARGKEAGHGFDDALRAGGRHDATGKAASEAAGRHLSIATRLSATLDEQALELDGEEEADAALLASLDQATDGGESEDDKTGDPAAIFLLALSGLHRPARPRGDSPEQTDGGKQDEAKAASADDAAAGPTAGKSRDAGAIILRSAIVAPAESEGAPDAQTRAVPDPTIMPSGEDDTKADAAPDRAAPKVTVVSQQTTIAPALQSQTSAALVESLATDTPFAEAVDRAALAMRHAETAPAPTHSLKLQLHPAELGMVTASLRLSGGQLAVELQVDNADAYHRLTTDGDAIVKALQGLGYEIDRVTVLQPQVATTATARVETTSQSMQSGGRGADSAGSGAAGNGGSGGRGEQAGGSGGNARQNDQQSRAAPRDGAGGGLYI